jgi:SOS-response transcriptional repressor LexA
MRLLPPPNSGRLIRGNRLTILAMILKARADRLPPPTIREMMAATGIKSPNGVTGHFDALKRLGLVARDGHAGRSVRPTCVFIPAEAL